jgi:hypothetical protein
MTRILSRTLNLPSFIVMTDRDTGTLWRVHHDASYVLVGITNAPVPKLYLGMYKQYGPYEGPIMGNNPRIRMLIRNGLLGYEVVDLGQGVTDQDNAPLNTRLEQSRFSLEVNMVGWVDPGDVLGYTQVFP